MLSLPPSPLPRLFYITLDKDSFHPLCIGRKVVDKRLGGQRLPLVENCPVGRNILGVIVMGKEKLLQVFSRRVMKDGQGKSD